MTKRIKTPGSEALLEARKAFKREYPHAKDWQIKRLALLSVSRDAIEAQVAAGQVIDLAALLRVDEVLEATRNAIDKATPLRISVRFVEGCTGTYKCNKCGEQNYLPPGTYEPLPERPKPAPVEAAPAPAPALTPKPAPEMVDTSRLHYGGENGNSFMGAVYEPAGDSIQALAFGPNPNRRI